MRKLAIVIFICAFTYLAGTAFSVEEGTTPRSTIKQRLNDRLSLLMARLSQLELAVQQADNSPARLQAIKSEYLQVREAYKSFEYLAEYLDPVFMKDNINGSPLPKLERNSYGINRLEPRGMQVLDELVYSDNLNDESEAIVKQVQLMQMALKDFNKPNFIYDRYVFEAARLELIRIFNLGLTGFDVPGSGNAIVDAHSAMTALAEDLALYYPMVAEKNRQLADSIALNVRGALRYLGKHNDFASFDRLAFLREYINPLYDQLLSAHLLLDIELPQETTKYLPAYNYMSRNLFANDFLDPLWYLTMPRSFYNEELITLGRTLFFDPILSVTNERSCASCHNPAKAFTDGNTKSIALGHEGTLERNAPTLINCVYSERYFHDLRADALEDQIEHVMVNEKEFNTDLLDMMAKLNKSPEYIAMFNSVFKSEPRSISKQNISFAIAAYVSSLRGFNSMFDTYVRGGQKIIEPAVVRGFNLFMGKAACGTCHFAPVFNGTVPPLYIESESEVLAVPVDFDSKHKSIDRDLGRSKARAAERVSFYDYSFKTPTLRNVALTAPYMHNGSFKTLEDVMEFYNEGGGKGYGILLEHQTLPFDKLNLSQKEIKDIIVFMESLTDTTGYTHQPLKLPEFPDAALNMRSIGGLY